MGTAASKENDASKDIRSLCCRYMTMVCLQITKINFRLTRDLDFMLKGFVYYSRMFGGKKIITFFSVTGTNVDDMKKSALWFIRNIK